MTRTRAERLLAEYYTETNENTNWTDVAGRAGVLAGLLTGGHYLGKHLQRKSLRKLGYVNHPYNTNIMIHPPTGKMFHLGRGMPIN